MLQLLLKTPQKSNLKKVALCLLLLGCGLPTSLFCDPTEAPGFVVNFSDLFNFSSQLRLIGFFLLVTILPFVLIMVTSFTRIMIIFHFLRQALSIQQVPTNAIIVGLSIILTGFVMHPVIDEIKDNAITPYFNGEFQQAGATQNQDLLLLTNVWKPLRTFLLQHTREKDLQLFMEIGNVQLEEASTPNASGVENVPWYCVVPAFVISELRTAFMMGFLLFLPFLIIDMVISSVLMSMGMIMLPPMLISVPFKLLLFILVDGWRLIVQQIVSGFTPT